MGDYQGISKTHWDEGEYKTETHQNVSAYLMASRDMAGVVGVHMPTTARKVRISEKKLLKTLREFEALNKLEFSQNETHIWWRSGIFHSLYKGKFTEKQLRSVQKLLRKWEYSAVFRQFWLKRVVNLYYSKYGMDLQLVMVQQPKGNAIGSVKQGDSTDTNTEADINTHTDRQTGIATAYLKRFGRKLEKSDQESLLKKYGDEYLLLMMIQHITINSVIKSPVGLLMTARDAPGSHLPDNQHDNWKREKRNVFARRCREDAAKLK